MEANAAALASVDAVAKITGFHYDTTSSCKPKPIGYSTHMNITQRAINAALKKAGLPVTIQNNRGGYSYFVSIETGYQVGDSVLLCYLNQQSIEEWVKDARYAISQDQQTNK